MWPFRVARQGCVSRSKRPNAASHTRIVESSLPVQISEPMTSAQRTPPVWPENVFMNRPSVCHIFVRKSLPPEITNARPCGDGDAQMQVTPPVWCLASATSLRLARSKMTIGPLLVPAQMALSTTAKLSTFSQSAFGRMRSTREPEAASRTTTHPSRSAAQTAVPARTAQRIWALNVLCGWLGSVGAAAAAELPLPRRAATVLPDAAPSLGLLALLPTAVFLLATTGGSLSAAASFAV